MSKLDLGLLYSRVRKNFISLDPFLRFLEENPKFLWTKFRSLTHGFGSSVVREIVDLRSDSKRRTYISEDDVVIALERIKDIVENFTHEHNFSDEETLELLVKVFNDTLPRSTQIVSAYDVAIANMDVSILKEFARILPKEILLDGSKYGAITTAMNTSNLMMRKGHSEFRDKFVEMLIELDKKEFLLGSFGFRPLFDLILNFPWLLRHPFFAFVILKEPLTLATIVRYYDDGRGRCPSGLKTLLHDVATIWAEETNRQLERGEEITYTPDFSDSLISGSCVEREIRELLKVQEQVFLAKEEQNARFAGLALLEGNQGEQYPEFNLPYLVASQMLAPHTQLMSRRR